MLQDQDVKFNTVIKFGDFMVAMRSILRPKEKRYSVINNYLTKDLIEETQKETISIFKLVLQSIINNTEITWALDDAVDVFLTTGSGTIVGKNNFVI